MARSVAPSSRAPASEVITPPVNEATTERPSTGAKTSGSGLHCVGIGELLWPEPSRCSTTTLPQSEPRCTSACEIYGLGWGIPLQDRRHVSTTSPLCRSDPLLCAAVRPTELALCR